MGSALASGRGSFEAAFSTRSTKAVTTSRAIAALR